MDRNLLLSFTFFLMMWHQSIQMQTLYVLNNRRRLRRWGVRPVNRSKDEHGFQHNLFEELWTSDAREFYEATRMWPEHFKRLHDLCEVHLRKRSLRRPLSVSTRLALTLT